MSADNIIVYQGEPGANSQIACQQVFPGMEPRACATFEEAFAAISEGDARLGMIPIENSLAGRVADIHHLLPESGLYIIGEHFLRIRFALMAPKGAKLDGIKVAQSHIMALGQCRKTLHGLGGCPRRCVCPGARWRHPYACRPPAPAAVPASRVSPAPMAAARRSVQARYGRPAGV